MQRKFMNAFRATLLAAFGALMFSAVANAQNADLKSSRKASVVLPLLEQLSPRETLIKDGFLTAGRV
jgi:hypothetical protein